MKEAFQKSKYADCLIPQLEHYYVRTLIEGINLRSGLDISNCISVDFPLKSAKRIVVYGNGEHGKKIIEKITKNPNYQLLAVLDKRWEEFSKEQYNVFPIHYVQEIVFDVILLAIVDKKIQCEILHQLRQLGIKTEQIRVV